MKTVPDTRPSPTLWLFVLLSLIPVLVPMAALTPVWLGLHRRAQVPVSAANALFLFLGQMIFPLFSPFLTP